MAVVNISAIYLNIWEIIRCIGHSSLSIAPKEDRCIHGGCAKYHSEVWPCVPSPWHDVD